MKVRGQLRVSGAVPESITVLRVTETACLFEAGRSLELGDAVTVELSVDGCESTSTGVITAANELQLVYTVRFDQASAPSPEALASLSALRPEDE